MEPLQLVLGLSVPALIIAHIIGVRLGETLFGHEKLYPQVLFLYWVWAPYAALDDARGDDHRLGPRLHRPVFLAADARGSTSAPRRFCSPPPCWFRRWRCWASIRAGEPSSTTTAIEWRAENLTPSQVGTRAEAQTLDRIIDYFLFGYFGLIGVALLARGARASTSAAAA